MKNDDFEKLKEMLEEDREPTPALLRAGKRYKELVVDDSGPDVQPPQIDIHPGAKYES